MCVFLADNVLVLVQEEQKRAQAALQEIEAKGSLKRQTKGGKNKV
jgi:[histone H3]-lysine9 N-trimethyltransferase EHMT